MPQKYQVSKGDRQNKGKLSKQQKSLQIVDRVFHLEAQISRLEKQLQKQNDELAGILSKEGNRQLVLRVREATNEGKKGEKEEKKLKEEKEEENDMME